MTQLNPQFNQGDQVIYGLHGRCTVEGIETRTISGQDLSFYKLLPVRPSFVKAKKPDPAIFLPVDAANKKGLRSPVGANDLESVYAILASTEFYFPLATPFRDIQTTLESCINTEGALGTAKVLSYLHGLKLRQLIPPSEVLKFHALVLHLLVRELAEVEGTSIKTVEEKIEKLLKNKAFQEN